MALTIEIYSGGSWQNVSDSCPYLGEQKTGLAPLRIEQEAENHVATAKFGLNGAGAAYVADRAEVRIVENTIPKTEFTGFIARFDQWRVGTEDVVWVECQDRTIQLEWTVVDEYTIDQGDADDTEIGTLFSTYLSAISTSTYVDQLDASMEELVLQGTMRDCLELICARTGGRFYVDFTDELHYFSGTDYPAANGWDLSDDPDFASTYPYQNFRKRTDGTRVFDRVYVVGEGVEAWVGAGDYETIVYDSSITTSQGVTDRGNALIGAFGTALEEYECDIFEDGLVVGIEIDVTHSDFAPGGVTLVVRQITMTCRSVDGAERLYHLRLGETGRMGDWFGGGGASGAPGERAPIFGDGSTITTIEPDDAAEVGEERFAAREDHRHAIVAAAPTGTITEATGNAEGSATSFARSDHTHDIDVSGTRAPIGAAYLVQALSGNLTAERVFTAGAGIVTTDNGANGTYVVAVDLVGAWSGLEFYGNDLRVDEDEDFTWTGAHSFADDVTLGTGIGVVHADGVTDGLVLRANGTRFVPAQLDYSDLTGSPPSSAPADAQYVVLAVDGDLSAERVLTAGDGLSATDGGANGTITLDVDLVAAWSGLEFSGGELRVDEDAAFDWTGAHTFASTVDVAEYVRHIGDTDTYARFEDDQITLYAGNVNMLQLTEGVTDYVRMGAAQLRLNGNSLRFDSDADTYAYASADDVVTLAIAGNEQYDFDATELTLSTTGGTEVLWLRTHGDVAVTGSDLYANQDLGIAADDNVWVFIDANASGAGAHFNIAPNQEIVSGATPALRVTEEAWVGINSTSTTGMTVGLRIDQGSNNDTILSLCSAITHGMTTYAPTDEYGQFSENNATYGGLRIRGLRDDSSGSVEWGAVAIVGYLGEAANTTKSASGHGIVQINTAIKSGAGIAAVTTNGNLVSIEDNGSARFLFDKEGEMHSDAVIGAGDDWDTWDDLALAADLSRLGKGKWDQVLQYQAEDFERAGLVTLSVDAEGRRHAFMKHRATLQFYACCFREVGQRLARYERIFESLGVSPALLEAG